MEGTNVTNNVSPNKTMGASAKQLEKKNKKKLLFPKLDHMANIFPCCHLEVVLLPVSLLGGFSWCKLQMASKLDHIIMSKVHSCSHLNVFLHTSRR